MEYSVVGQLVVVEEKALTPMLLMQLSEELLRDYKASGSHEDKPDDEGRLVRTVTKYYDSFLHELSRRAEEAAVEMKGAGIESAPRFWGFTTCPPLQLKEGDKLTIPKGVTVSSTAPASQGNFPRALSRAQTVTVHRASSGFYSDWSASDHGPWSPGQVHWAGAGGYWRWVSLDELQSALMQVEEKSQHEQKTVQPGPGI